MSLDRPSPNAGGEVNPAAKAERGAPVSPYLVLGVPNGATIEEARAAFEARIAHLAAHGSDAFITDDLHWALEQIESGATEGPFALQIPADPDLFDATDVVGLFNRPAQPMPRTTATLDDQTRTLFVRRAMHEAASAILATATKFPEAPLVYTVDS